jgi:hypothetical protein
MFIILLILILIYVLFNKRKFKGGISSYIESILYENNDYENNEYEDNEYEKQLYVPGQELNFNQVNKTGIRNLYIA